MSQSISLTNEQIAVLHDWLHGDYIAANETPEKDEIGKVLVKLERLLTRRAADGATREQYLDRVENNVIAMQERRRLRRR